MSTAHMQMEEASNSDSTQAVPKPQVIYRCKKCRRIVASDENIVPHERGKGEECFRYRKKGDLCDNEKEQADCSSIFVESMMWMQPVQEGYLAQKLQCMGCNARLGFFSWAGMQCNCGAWVTPAFQLHKSKLDECHI